MQMGKENLSLLSPLYWNLVQSFRPFKASLKAVLITP